MSSGPVSRYPFVDQIQLGVEHKLLEECRTTRDFELLHSYTRRLLLESALAEASTFLRAPVSVKWASARSDSWEAGDVVHLVVSGGRNLWLGDKAKEVAYDPERAAGSRELVTAAIEFGAGDALPERLASLMAFSKRMALADEALSEHSNRGEGGIWDYLEKSSQPFDPGLVLQPPPAEQEDLVM